MTDLSAMRGAALEPCFKEIVVALRASREPVQPAEFYFKPRGQARGHLYGDVEMLNAMWKLAGRLRQVLEAHGFELRWAQSTYRRTDTQHNTRGSTFTVDLTVRRTRQTFWLEVKYTDDATLKAGVKQAKKSLEKYKKALQKTSAWCLVENLGGWPMRAPAAYGYFVCGPSSYSFDLTGECVVQGTWDDHRAMVPLRSQALRLYQKRSRKKATRKRNAQQRSAVSVALDTGAQRRLAAAAQATRTLKRPASTHAQAA